MKKILFLVFALLPFTVNADLVTSDDFKDNYIGQVGGLLEFDSICDPGTTNACHRYYINNTHYVFNYGDYNAGGYPVSSSINGAVISYSNSRIYAWESSGNLVFVKYENSAVTNPISVSYVGGDFYYNDDYVFYNGQKIDVNAWTSSSSSNDLVSPSTFTFTDGYVYLSFYSVGPVFNFFTSGYSFIENGFYFNNFVPSPSGGTLSFEIIAPSGTSTIDLTTNSFGAQSYGYDTAIGVTYPYHQEAGEYQVRPTYTYAGVKYYPFGEDYNTYTITVPEIDAVDDLEWNTQTCNDENANDGFLPGVSNFFLCASTFLGGIVENINNVSSGIYQFFSAFGQIGNTEEYKLLDSAFNWIIPSANASTYTYDENEDVLKMISQGSFSNIPLLDNIYNLLKYTILFILLVFVVNELFINKKNDA